ncbi:hypothetical protein B0H11DRAFT_1948640 [Mycena galericulata]|nr:hypothetical protein B0H11DRAFT_1948640 [Mycena galericulata]
MQHLLSLTSLKCVQVRCRYGDPSIFQHIWKNLSPGIKDIELKVPGLDSSLPDPTLAHTGALLKIGSLKVRGLRGIVRWLASDRCPFDFSHLRALHLGTNPSILHSPALIAAAKTLEMLTIEARLGTYAVDLSPYARLEFLDIYCDSDEHLPKALETLRTIPRGNRIKKVRIFGCSDDGSRWIKKQFPALQTLGQNLEAPGVLDSPLAPISTLWCAV